MRPRRASALRLSPTRHCLPAVALLVLSLHVLLACRIGKLPAAGYHVAPLNPAFGVEVRGADLNADLNADLRQRIREDLSRWEHQSSTHGARASAAGWPALCAPQPVPAGL